MDLHTSPVGMLHLQPLRDGLPEEARHYLNSARIFLSIDRAVHSANPRKCGYILEKRLIHPCATCNKGPAKNRHHDYIKVSLGDSLADANDYVDYERFIPELCIGDTSNGRGSDAVMDVVAAFPNAMRQYWIDVTIRSPRADRYNLTAGSNASNTIGLAASGGCK